MILRYCVLFQDGNEGNVLCVNIDKGFFRVLDTGLIGRSKKIHLVGICLQSCGLVRLQNAAKLGIIAINRVDQVRRPECLPEEYPCTE